MQKRSIALVFALGGLSFGCCTATAQQGQINPVELRIFNDAAQLEASIVRTKFGVAHVTAANLEALAFGNGYAQAEDHACVLADSYLRVRGERAKYLGADQFTAGDQRHIASDYLYRLVGIKQRVAAGFDRLPASTQAMAQGFAKGYNLFLRDVLAGKAHLGEECRAAKWVQPIDAADVIANITAIGVAQTLAHFGQAMLQANPGQGQEWMPVDKHAEQTLVLPPWLEEGSSVGIGSNAWALGAEKTEDGRGLLLANPHFPLRGNLRFWAHHAEIPGQLNVMGASIVGFPAAVNIGFNQDVAWTHTFSAASHKVIYQLSLDPTHPMQYLLDGQPQPISKETIEIEVKTAAGQRTLSKVVYRAAAGILIEVPGSFDWTSQQAFVLKDTNLDNFSALAHWLAINQARDLASFKATFASRSGLMFNNTLYADKSGDVFYVDSSNVPDLPASALQFLAKNAPAEQVFQQTGTAVLPGHNSEFYFTADIPFQRSPQLQRRDFVQNSNNSYWLSNPSAALSGFSPLYGPVQTEQSLRTRYSLSLLATAGGTDSKFNQREVEYALLANGAYASQFQPELLSLCAQWRGKMLTLADGRQVSPEPVCAAVAKWDGHFKLESEAAHLIREFSALLDPAQDFLHPFDLKDPVHTPRTLQPNETVLAKLVLAGEIITNAGFSLTAPLRQLQFFQLQSGRLPWPGSAEVEGGFNVFGVSNSLDQTVFARVPAKVLPEPGTDYPLYSGLSLQGYDINFGSSWLMTVDFEAQGPVARGLLTSSQSTLTDSPHVADQSLLYSQNPRLLSLPFSAAEIRQQKISEKQIKVSSVH
jgi:acyl-homoserine-lactone acylase